MGVPNTIRERWLYALKPASWPKLLVPMLFGQGLGVALAGRSGSFGGALYGISFTVLDTIYVVLLNDFFDQEVDTLKRRMFPHGCSPKTIPDRILPSSHVLVGGVLALALCLCMALLASVLLRQTLFVLTLACLAVFVGYSLPPLRLNYRGGGEFLEMLGVGFALPWLNAYAVSGVALAPVYALLPGFMCFALASAVASGLSDEVSDRLGGKRTVTTRFGNRIARQSVEILVVLGVLAWIGAAVVLELSGSERGELLAVLPGSALAIAHWLKMRRHSAPAATNAFAEQAAYKNELHRAIWRSTALVACLLCGQSLLR